jgi:hypothetical protein
MPKTCAVFEPYVHAVCHCTELCHSVIPCHLCYYVLLLTADWDGWMDGWILFLHRWILFLHTAGVTDTPLVLPPPPHCSSLLTPAQHSPTQTLNPKHSLHTPTHPNTAQHSPAQLTHPSQQPLLPLLSLCCPCTMQLCAEPGACAVLLPCQARHTPRHQAREPVGWTWW